MAQPETTRDRPSAPPYDIEFEIAEVDLVNFLRLMQRSTNLIGLGLGLATMAMAVFLTFQGDTVLGVGGFILGIAIVLISQTEYIDKRRVRRAGDSVIGTRAHYVVAESGIEIQAGRSVNHVDWSGLSHVRENERIVVFMNGPRARGWIPASALGSEAERVQFLAFVKARIAAADPKLKAAAGTKGSGSA